LNEKEKDLGHWGYLLPVVLVFLSAMMVSRGGTAIQLQVRWGCADSTNDIFEDRRRGAVRRLPAGSAREDLYYVLPLFFTGYLVYGFVRPHISAPGARKFEEGRRRLGNGKTNGRHASILLAALAGYLCSLTFSLDHVRPGQPHHPQRGRAARLPLGAAHRPRGRDDGDDLLRVFVSPASPRCSTTASCRRSCSCSALFSSLPGVQISAGQVRPCADQAGHRHGKNRDADRAEVPSALPPT